MGKPEGNSETWLTTYSDMVTLLLVFFVLLYTLTPGVEDSAFDSFISYFQKSTGVLDESGMAPQGAQKQSGVEESTGDQEQEAEWEAFKDFLEEHNLSSEVSIRRVDDGVLITLSDSLTFESGSADLLPAAKEVLTQVGKLLDERVKDIEVQGHTDDVPISASSRYPTNWHLGAARAVSVVEYLHGEANIAPERFKASSFGEYKLVASNDTKAGRRKNRRVEIYIREKEFIEEGNKNTNRIIDLSEKKMAVKNSSN